MYRLWAFFNRLLRKIAEAADLRSAVLYRSRRHVASDVW